MRYLVVALVALLLGVGLAVAQTRLDHERITDYDVTVQVAADGLTTVTERITVVALGREIRRGIYRDLPLVQESLLGRSQPAFDLVAVRRDGKAEPHSQEAAGDGIRIYVGDPDRLLQPGVHTYELVYTVARQVRFFDGFDEIYWNVTGNDWAFRIENARVRVIPPPRAPVLQVAGYTGARGDTEQAVEIASGAAGEILVTATRQLAPGEGLTVAVGWAKGYVAEPTAAERWRWFLTDSRQSLVALAVLGLVLVYYLLVWHRVGRDPRGGPIIPVYAPTLPPAAMRYIRRMGYDDRCLAAALVSLAVKGYLVIRDGDGTPTVERRDTSSQPASPGEDALRRTLFATGSRVALDRESRKTLIAARRALKGHFDKTFDTTFFRHNRPYFMVGAGLTVLGWLAVAASAPTLFETLFLSVWLAGWSVGTGWLLVFLVRQWRLALGGAGFGHVFGALFGTAFAMPFVGGWLFGVFALSQAVGPAAAVFLVAALGLNILFFRLLRAPTAIGRDALDEIEGMLLYLTVAEAERLRFHHGSPITPELFERFLPYAIALDVETQWAEQFAEALRQAQRTGQETYRPIWYGGRSFDAAGISAIGGSISSAVGSATAQSSSGSGGGGSSGGGGGGGGGGGW